MSNKFKIGDKITVDISDTLGEIYAIDEESGKKIYSVISDETGSTLECTEDRLKHVIIKEQEKEATFEERQLREEVERLKRVREIALKANLELQEEIKSLQGTVESYSERLAGYRDEVKQLKQGKEDYKILVTFYNSDDITQYRVLPKESLNRGVNKLIKQGARTFDFYKLRGELKVKTIKTYEIDEQ